MNLPAGASAPRPYFKMGPSGLRGSREVPTRRLEPPWSARAGYSKRTTPEGPAAVLCRSCRPKLSSQSPPSLTSRSAPARLQSEAGRLRCASDYQNGVSNPVTDLAHVRRIGGDPAFLQPIEESVIHYQTVADRKIHSGSDILPRCVMLDSRKQSLLSARNVPLNSTICPGRRSISVVSPIPHQLHR
jgi:hypothetical protein